MRRHPQSSHLPSVKGSVHYASYGVHVIPSLLLFLSDPMPAVQLKNTIRRLRFEKNMTQEELALRVGVSRQTIMSIEQGRTNPSILLALSISKALSVVVTEVFSMEGNLAPV